MCVTGGGLVCGIMAPGTGTTLLSTAQVVCLITALTPLVRVTCNNNLVNTVRILVKLFQRIGLLLKESQHHHCISVSASLM